jgi:hypothetical protein
MGLSSSLNLLILVCCFLTVPSALTASLPDRSEAQEGFPSYNYGDVENKGLEKRQSDSPIIVTGVHSGVAPNGSVPLRLEVRELEKNADQWTLYLLALDKWEYTNQSDLLSWYSVAGELYLPFLFFSFFLEGNLFLSLQFQHADFC